MVNASFAIPVSEFAELKIDTNYDSSNLEQKTKLRHIERHISCAVVSKEILSEVKHDATLEEDAAWEALKRSIVYFKGKPIGTVAAIDKSQGELNYDQVFMRDFVPSALAFLMKGEPQIVKNFLLETAHLQSRDKMVDLFKLGKGVMPASFKVHHSHPPKKTETLVADFGEIAIGRVAPVDSGLWWIFILSAYTHFTMDKSLANSRDCQEAMRLILNLWLSEGFDTSPALLCADGCSMIDRRMGIYGYKTEEYSETALNKFNVMPESIPDWIFGNVSPARMDFRWLCLGNFIAILSSLATEDKAEAILDLVEERWEQMENHESQIVTGCDPKNTRWSYHNGGSWPRKSHHSWICT